MNYYKYLTKKEGVCGGRVTVAGTRIEPSHIIKYGTFDEIEEDFGLTKEQIAECYHYEISKLLPSEEDKDRFIKDWKEVGNILSRLLNWRG